MENKIYYLVYNGVILATAHHNEEENTIEVHDAFINCHSSDDEHSVERAIIESYRTTIEDAEDFFAGVWTTDSLLSQAYIVPASVYNDVYITELTDV